MENDYITFSAALMAYPRTSSIPVGNVIALFAGNRRMGMNFDVGNQRRPAATRRPEADSRPKGAKPESLNNPAYQRLSLTAFFFTNKPDPDSSRPD